MSTLHLTAAPRFGLLNFTFVDALHGWMLGYKVCGNKTCFAMRISTDGGKSWQDSPAPQLEIPVGGSEYEILNKVRFANLKDGWVYGAKALFVTHDGGKTWQQDPLSGKITDLKILGNTVWTLEGSCSQPKSPELPICNYRIITSNDYGRNWQPLVTQPFTTTFLLPPKVSRATLQDAWVMANLGDANVGSKVSLKVTHDGGKSWQQVDFPQCSLAPNYTTLVAVNTTQLRLICNGGAATIMVQKAFFSSNDGGKSWQKVSSAEWDGYKDKVGDIPFSGLASDLVFTSLTRGYMIFSRNTLHVTNDGGKTWTATSLADKDYHGGAGGEENLVFVDTQHGWVKFTNKIVRTSDGGATWEEFPIN